MQAYISSDVILSGASVKGTKEFLFGYINMRIKLVPDDSAAVVTTYYVSHIVS